MDIIAARVAGIGGMSVSSLVCTRAEIKTNKGICRLKPEQKEKMFEVGKPVLVWQTNMSSMPSKL